MTITAVIATYNEAETIGALLEGLRECRCIVVDDSSPDGTGRPCRPVWDALNAFAAHLERDFDVHIVDDGGVGMAGWVRRNGERAP
jgi:hypothetical protein